MAWISIVLETAMFSTIGDNLIVGAADIVSAFDLPGLKARKQVADEIKKKSSAPKMFA